MDLKEQFDAAIAKAGGLPISPTKSSSSSTSLFKQATVGDVEGDRPSGFDFRGAGQVRHTPP